MLLELDYLILAAFGYMKRPREFRERLCQFIRSPPHGVQLVRDFLRVQVLERTCVLK